MKIKSIAWKNYLLVIFSISLTMCTVEQNKIDPAGVKGPRTVQVSLENYKNVLYVDNASNTSEKEGTKDAPFSSLKDAIESINDASENNRYVVLVDSGDYYEGTINLKEYVDVYGGFSPIGWERDIEKYITKFSGQDKERVFNAADKCVIDGFTISNGSIKGTGAGINCIGVSPVISNNTFFRNKTLKPIPWNPKFWHETANDGGAVYCEKGSKAEIKNNLFVENKTENGRGAGIAANNHCDLLIEDNIFFNNVAGLDDPMRSSDGGAISIFDWCNAVITGNIILSNNALSRNDAGGIFVALWSSAEITDNVLVDNEAGDDAGALFVGGQEHRYDAPLDPIPPADKFFVKIDNNTFIGNRNSSMNSGAMRFTMESRGEFSNNIVAQNNGIYFQRSEVSVLNNLILDNFLYMETKEGLKLGTISGNILWANFDLQIGATVENNNMKNVYDEKNYSSTPQIKDDAVELIVLAANYLKTDYCTTITVLKNLKINEYANRVVKVNGKWNVITSNDANTLKILGKYNSVASLNILPTYTLIKQ